MSTISIAVWGSAFGLTDENQLMNPFLIAALYHASFT